MEYHVEQYTQIILNGSCHSLIVHKKKWTTSVSDYKYFNGKQEIINYTETKTFGKLLPGDLELLLYSDNVYTGLFCLCNGPLLNAA